MARVLVLLIRMSLSEEVVASYVSVSRSCCNLLSLFDGAGRSVGLTVDGRTTSRSARRLVDTTDTPLYGRFSTMGEKDLKI